MNKKTNNNCLKCNSPFIRTRNPNQQYCSQLDCQSTRKSLWHKLKRKNDPDYQYSHNQACKKWRGTNKDYCRKYRDSHPKYTVRNCQLQRDRDFKRAKAAAKCNESHLAKSDALIPKVLIPEGLYRLIPESCDLAKSDALTFNPLLLEGLYRLIPERYDLAKI